MSRDRQKKKTVIRSRKQQPDPYTSRITKKASKRELKDTLRHAVSHRDFDALEDFDEKNLKPPVGAVVPVKEETFEDITGDVYDPKDLMPWPEEEYDPGDDADLLRHVNQDEDDWEDEQARYRHERTVEDDYDWD